MKKTYILLLLIPIFLQSCLKDDTKIFEQTASDRVNNTLLQAQQVLTEAKNGWIFKFFPDESYGGYNFVMNFTKADVTMSMELADNNYKETSLYQLKAEAGPILSFDTYNTLIHYFRKPSQANVDGYGGDYEFIILNVSSDKISLKGKLSGRLMYMIPAPKELSAEKFLENISNTSAKLEGKRYALKVKGDSVAIVTTTMGGRVLELNTIDKSGKKNKEQFPVVLSENGFDCFKALTVNGVTASSFVFDENGNLKAQGADMLLKELLVSKYSFNQYIGKWNLNSTEGKSFPVEIKVAEQGKTLLLEGVFLETNGIKTELPLKLNYKDGIVTFVPQFAAKSSILNIWALCILAEGGQTSINLKLSYDGAWNGDSNFPKIEFSSQGGVSGISFNAFLSDTPSSSSHLEGMMRLQNITLSK